MDHIFDVIIIGGGPAGYTAALYASRSGLDTVILERLSAGGQMSLTGEIDNYPGFEDGIDGFTLGIKMQKEAEKFGAKTEFADVKNVDFSEKIKKIETQSRTFCGKTVIIASGASPRELGVDGENALVGKGVHYCAHCDGRFYKDKTVAVVGGGNSAVTDALYLARLARTVYLIHRRDKLKASKIYCSMLKNTPNVKIIWNSTVESLEHDERLKEIQIKNTESLAESVISCDGLFVSIGRKPATDFLSGKVFLDKNGYIIADETTKTNVSGVFAAGDVRTKALRQIVTAVSDGAVAATFAEEYLS